MIAVRFHRVGDPSVLHLDEVPDPPAPTGDQLLVRVQASSINGTDLGLRRGGLRVATVGRLPLTLGFDLAGEVVQCGPAVTAFSPGDRVMALLGHGGGGQAGLVLVRQGRAASVPHACTPEEAAALPLAGLTALQALHGKAALHARQRGSRVLVVGAAGGIGSYAVQLAKAAGAHVTGVASSGKLDAAAGFGADDVLDRSSFDVRAERARWDVVLDTPGTLRLSDADAALTPGGVLVSTLPLSVDAVTALVRPRRRDSRPRFTAVATRARTQDLARLARMTDDGRLRPTLTRAFPAAAAADAHRHAEAAATGKVVLTF